MAKTKKRPESKPMRIFRIIKNILFVVILAALLSVTIVTLTARINGETPVIFGNALYRVSSGSMAPTLEVGDIILCRECDPMELEAGDIITYDGTSGQFAGKKVTHRVVKPVEYNKETGKYILVTKGDDNPVEDTPIEASQVTGKFVRKIDFLKSIFNFFITPWGLLALIGLIILAFFNEIVNFVRALLGYDYEEHEDIQDIIERVQRESAEKQKTEPDDKADN